MDTFLFIKTTYYLPEYFPHLPGYKRKGEYHNRYECVALTETAGSDSCRASLGASAAPGGSLENYRYEISFDNITQQAGILSSIQTLPFFLSLKREK